MYKFVFAVGITVAMGALLSLIPSEYTVIGNTEEIVEEEIAEVLPSEWLEEAEAAKEAVIARKRLESELAELDVIKASTTARMEEIEKELGTY